MHELDRHNQRNTPELVFGMETEFRDATQCKVLAEWTLRLYIYILPTGFIEDANYARHEIILASVAL